MGFLQNKRILIVGIASNRSIAWGVAEAMHREGAELALTYQTEKLKKRVDDAAEIFGTNIVMPLDVTSDEQITDLFAALEKEWGHLDGIIHAVGFAPRDHLEGGYLDNLTRDGFAMAHDISSYSFAALAKAGRSLMQGRNASLVTMSYLGAVRTVPHYNVMGVAKASLEASVRYLAESLGPEGIRVNGISAGPIRTLAASGIKNFKGMLDEVEKMNPLRRNVTIEEVGNTTAFLCSDLASGITGDIIYVDSGYHILGKA
ncbi:MAG: enoyl-ACP reductase [Candidatus Thiodiazotropha sp. (ex Ustalcina ferruginea)]|nr:enoyl-ACP reductase [Candidatus Thiodiazotropha sp. (ex Ustalcina ferruginea)]